MLKTTLSKSSCSRKCFQGLHCYKITFFLWLVAPSEVCNGTILILQVETGAGTKKRGGVMLISVNIIHLNEMSYINSFLIFFFIFSFRGQIN